jgi:hypothetical protein
MTDSTDAAEDIDQTETPTGNSSTMEEHGDPDEGTETARTPDEPTDADPDTFPREVVERLRQENGRYRQRAQRADSLAHRLHTELVRATGRLADPSDLDYADEHLDDPDTLAAAIDDLLARKPHLASRRPVGDIGQGNRGSSSEPFSLLGLLKERV